MSLNIKHKRSAVAGSAPTPAQLEDGELAVNYNDTDPALYIKDSAGAVVRIAGEGAVGGDLQAVTDTGNTTTNDVLIGGTLPSSPNISLNADGSAGYLGAGRYLDSTGTNTVLIIKENNGYGELITGSQSNGLRLGASNGNPVEFFVSNNANPYARLDSNGLGIGGTLPSSPNISLNADGSGEFAGNVTASATGDSDNQVFLDSRGAVLAFRETTASTWSSLSSSSSVVPSTGYQLLSGGNYNAGTRVATSWINSNGSAYFQDQVGIGGTLPSSPNIELNAIGTIASASNITSGTFLTSGTTESGARLGASGYVYVQRPAGDNGITHRVYQGNVVTTENRANGYQWTVGNVSVGGTSSVPNIELNADGSAEFAGLLKVDRDATTLATFKRAGATRFAIGDAGVYVGTDVSPGANPITGNNISLNADGTGVFKKIGIGTSSPGRTLSVHNAGSNASFVQVTNSTTGNNAADGSIFGIGNDEALIIYQQENNYLALGTNNTERLRIDASGDVLIGGTLPSAPNISLNANGSATFALDATINGLTVGLGGGSLSTNTAIGVNTLLANTTGNSNTAIGRTALRNNTEGGSNTAVGWSALLNNTTGLSNTSLGREALQGNTDGGANTALGLRANYSNTTGGYNTTVGMDAGYFIEGSNNTVLGAYRGTSADATLSNTVIISAGTTERARCHSTGVWNLGTSAPVYADNTAAKAGGLVDGDIYRKADGTLMIAFT